MNIKTDITTLSKLYPLFEEAGMEGMLTGDMESISKLSFPELCGKLLKTGKLAEVCELITGANDNGVATWCEVSLEEAMGVVVPFLVSITTGRAESAKKETEAPSPETSL